MTTTHLSNISKIQCLSSLPAGFRSTSHHQIDECLDDIKVHCDICIARISESAPSQTVGDLLEPVVPMLTARICDFLEFKNTVTKDTPSTSKPTNPFASRNESLIPRSQYNSLLTLHSTLTAFHALLQVQTPSTEEYQSLRTENQEIVAKFVHGPLLKSLQLYLEEAKQ